MARVLPAGQLFRGLPDGPHGGGGHALPGGVSRGGHGGFYGLWTGTNHQRHLERSAVERDDQGSGRWVGLRLADRGDVWVVVAEIKEELASKQARGKEKREKIEIEGKRAEHAPPVQGRFTRW